MKRAILSISLLLVLGISAFCQVPDYNFTRSRLFPGFDGKLCKQSPSIATDWEGTMVLTYGHLLLTGSDVFYGKYFSKSTDGGKTWSKPKKFKSLKDTWDGEIRLRYGVSPFYSRYHKKWYALGGETKYEGDKVPFQKVVDGKAWRHPYYADFDIRTCEFKNIKEIPFPFEYAGATLFGEPYELENGDILQTFYYVPIEATKKKSKVVVVRYRFVEGGLEVVEAGTPVECQELNRGVGEPSLTYFQGKYYMTIRSDERGMFCESEDGLHFGPLKTWCWEDGTPIGNKNTQQHWINLGDRLYLTYTRETATNKHVFRNRAPVYSALFDPEKGAIIRDTEFPLVPELGARLGNFHTISDYCGTAYFVTAEWMQPIGCEKYGSDNSIWFLKFWK